MNHCNNIRDALGAYLDGEATALLRNEIDAHVCQCADCAVELEELRALARAVADAPPCEVPAALWDSIEAELKECAVRRPRLRTLLRNRPWLALAAMVTIVAGLGWLALPTQRNGVTAQAATVDFAELLDAMQGDARAAFDRFLAVYQAKPATPRDAQRHAPGLSFDLPPLLPGGFEIRETWLLRFGKAPGVAARYDRNGEFLAVVFHSPVLLEHYGTHQDHDCVVGQHRGHKVPVGEWSLVHLTDPTTCHCVLSRLDESTELPAVMAAIAPRADFSTPHDHHHHRP
jgi:hypothetical protein